MDRPDRTPSAPRGLGADASAAWRAAWSAPWLASTDRPTVEHYARLVDHRSRVATELAGVTLTISGSRGQVAPHPLIAVLHRIDVQIAAALDQLALNPRGRRRQGVETAEPSAPDPMEEFLERARRRKT